MKGCSATSLHNVATVVYGFVTRKYDSVNLTGMLPASGGRAWPPSANHPTTPGRPRKLRAPVRVKPSKNVTLAIPVEPFDM